MGVRFALDRFLQEHQLTAYKLHKQTQGEVSKASIFTLARGDTKRIDLDSIYHILNALSALLKRPVQIQELFEVELDPNPQLKKSRSGLLYTGTPDTDEWYDAVPDFQQRLEAVEDAGGDFLTLEELLNRGGQDG